MPLSNKIELVFPASTSKCQNLPEVGITQIRTSENSNLKSSQSIEMKKQSNKNIKGTLHPFRNYTFMK